MQVTEEALHEESVSSSVIMAPSAVPEVATATEIPTNSHHEKAVVDTAQQVTTASIAPPSNEQWSFFDELIKMRATVASLELENERLRSSTKERHSEFGEESKSIRGNRIQNDNNDATRLIRLSL